MNQLIRVLMIASVLAIASVARPASADTIGIGGVSRSFVAQLPDTKPAPLVIVLHGNTQTGADMTTRTSWPAGGKRESFGGVFPDGLNRAWADLRLSTKRARPAPPKGPPQ